MEVGLFFRPHLPHLDVDGCVLIHFMEEKSENLVTPEAQLRLCHEKKQGSASGFCTQTSKTFSAACRLSPFSVLLLPSQQGQLVSLYEVTLHRHKEG